MAKVKALLDELQSKEKEIFPTGFEKSVLKAKDVTEISKELGIKFPVSYKEFLRTYKIPSSKVYMCFCGDLYTNSFGITFSRTENKYVNSEGEEIVIEFEWTNYDISSVEAFVKSFHEKTDGAAAWAKAGFIYLGEFRGYQVYLDGKKDIVYSIYHEDMYESEDYDDPKSARECMEENAHELCDNFEQFLKVICTGMPFDEDDHVFIGDESESESVNSEKDQECIGTYIIKIGEPSDVPIRNRDKIGGFPTYMPDHIPKVSKHSGYFLMEIYNHGFADSDILCWQIYSAETTAALISDVIEISKGALLYDESSKLIKKRRWLREYPISLEKCDPKLIDDKTSAIGGKVPKKVKYAFKRKNITYLGTIRGLSVPNKEFEIDAMYSEVDEGILAMGFDGSGKLHVESFDN